MKTYRIELQTRYGDYIHVKANTVGEALDAARIKYGLHRSFPGVRAITEVIY